MAQSNSKQPVIDLVQDPDGVYRDPFQPRDPEPIEFEFDKEPGDWKFHYRFYWGESLKPIGYVVSVA